MICAARKLPNYSLTILKKHSMSADQTVSFVGCCTPTVFPNNQWQFSQGTVQINTILYLCNLLHTETTTAGATSI